MSNLTNAFIPTSGNSTNLTVLPYLSSGTLYFWYIFNMSCAVSSAVLILLLVIAIFRNDKLRHGSGVLIAHLLCVNFLICGFTQPTYLTSIFIKVTNPNARLQLHCAAFMYTHVSLFRTECFASLLMAVNRFFAIVFPHYYNFLTKTPTICVMIALSWLCGFAIYFPTLFGYGHMYGKFAPFYSCGTRPLNDNVLPILASLGTNVPISLLGVLYIVIAVKVRFDQGTGRSQRMDKRITIAKMLCGAFVFYVCCFMPMTVGAAFFPNVTFRQPVLLMWLSALQMLGCSGHPVVFLTLNKDYRKSFLQLVRGVQISPRTTEFSLTRRSRGEQLSSHNAKA